MATFHILPEILSIIMEHMDMEDLLNACSVNRIWYDVAISSARCRLSRFLKCVPQLEFYQVLFNFWRVRRINTCRLQKLGRKSFLQFVLSRSSPSYAPLHWAGTTLDATQGIKFKLEAEREGPAMVCSGMVSVGCDSSLPSLGQVRIDLESTFFPATAVILIFRKSHETPNPSMPTQTNSTIETLKITEIWWRVHNWPEVMTVRLPQSVVERLEVVARPLIKFESMRPEGWSPKSLELDLDVSFL
jgi:hypothetical protein